MKNNRGLTLIELMAVLVVLVIVGLLMSPVIFEQIKDYRQQMYDDQVSIIEDAARVWAVDHIDQLPNLIGKFYGVTIGELQEGGYLEPDFTNPITRKPFPTDSLVQIECIVSSETNYTYRYTYVNHNAE